MRILYGISSDGLGRTLRARVVAEHLVSLGHDVRLSAAGDAVHTLRDHGFQVVDFASDVEAALEQALRFDPELVLTDFSYFACLVAHLTGVPLVPLGGETRGARAESYSQPTRRSS